MVVALSLIVKVILVVKLTQACENSIEQNINGCDFDPLDIIVESTGFLITSENCGLIVPKENFFERPHVFYYKAEEDQMYTLIMIEESGDLGFDKRSLLWLVSNIPVTIYLVLSGFIIKIRNFLKLTSSCCIVFIGK